MFAKRVIPCLDVSEGRVVKGTNFLNLRDAGDPVEVAARYEREGADELVFLDITASHEGRDIILDVVRRTAEVIFMPLCVGGGIRDLDDIRALLNAGCDKVSINSAACRDPEFVSQPCAGLRDTVGEVRAHVAVPRDRRNEGTHRGALARNVERACDRPARLSRGFTARAASSALMLSEIDTYSLGLMTGESTTIDGAAGPKIRGSGAATWTARLLPETAHPHDRGSTPAP